MPRNTAEPFARPNAIVQAAVGDVSPGSSAAERIAVRRPLVRTHGTGDFRGTVKDGGDRSAPWSKIASDPKMVGSVFCGSCG
jgi:hypothetical protein